MAIPMDFMHCIGMTRPRSRYSGHRRVCEGRVGVEKPGAGAVQCTALAHISRISDITVTPHTL